MGVIFKPTTEDSNYDVNKDAEHVVGPVNAAEVPSDGSNGQQASPQQSFTPVPTNLADDEHRLNESNHSLWNASDPNNNGRYFSHNGKLYVVSNGKYHEASRVAGGDYSLTEIPSEEGKRKEQEHILYLYENGPKEPGLQAPLIDPVDVISAGLAGGSLAAARAGGSLFGRIGTGIQTGSLDMAKEAGQQIIGNTVKEWYK